MRLRTFLDNLKKNADAMKHEVTALFLAYKNHDIPLLAKVVAIITVGYALSPIDLIPDFIPILGYLDDWILLPLGIALAIKLIPPEIMAQCRVEAENLFKDKAPSNRIAGFVILLIWLMIAGVVIMKLLRI